MAARVGPELNRLLDFYRDQRIEEFDFLGERMLDEDEASIRKLESIALSSKHPMRADAMDALARLQDISTMEIGTGRDYLLFAIPIAAIPSSLKRLADNLHQFDLEAIAKAQNLLPRSTRIISKLYIGYAEPGSIISPLATRQAMMDVIHAKNETRLASLLPPISSDLPNPVSAIPAVIYGLCRCNVEKLNFVTLTCGTAEIFDREERSRDLVLGLFSGLQAVAGSGIYTEAPNILFQAIEQSWTSASQLGLITWAMRMGTLARPSSARFMLVDHQPDQSLAIAMRSDGVFMDFTLFAGAHHLSAHDMSRLVQGHGASMVYEKTEHLPPYVLETIFGPACQNIN